MSSIHLRIYSWLLILVANAPTALSFMAHNSPLNTRPVVAVTTLFAASTRRPVAAVFGDVKAVIFDVDGTLADSGQLGFEATNVVLQTYNVATVTYEDYCEGTRYTTPDRLASHAGLTPEKDGEQFRALGQKLGQEFDDLYINLVSIQTAKFFPGMLELVHNIPDSVRVGTLTNAAGRYAHAVLKANDTVEPLSLYERFGSILGADEVVRPKPYGDGLLQVCRELSVHPAVCVYIGDSPSDGLAAQAAGMAAIGVTWGAHSAESLQQQAPHSFSHICHTVDELASLLPQRAR
jgi:HAD superfamily hydrolase (TIGR01509 family)